MELLRGIGRSEAAPILKGEAVYLRAPLPGDFAEWAEIRRESAGFLRPWEPSWGVDDLTRTGYRRRLRRYARDQREDQAYPFFFFRQSDDALLGGVTLSNVRRGVTQSCSIGYWIGARYARKGLTSDAVRVAARRVFEGLGLHRLEAACLPENEPSRRLLVQVGFRHEGFARRYLKINGQWRDHLLFGLTAEDRKP